MTEETREREHRYCVVARVRREVDGDTGTGRKHQTLQSKTEKGRSRSGPEGEKDPVARRTVGRRARREEKNKRGQNGGGR